MIRALQMAGLLIVVTGGECPNHCQGRRQSGAEAQDVVIVLRAGGHAWHASSPATTAVSGLRPGLRSVADIDVIGDAGCATVPGLNRHSLSCARRVA